MSGDQVETNERVAEGAISKRIHQAIPYLLAIISFLLVRSLADIERSQATQAEAQVKQSEQLAVVSSDVRVLSTRIDYSVLESIKEMKKRLDRLEQAVKTP